jgi:hypothetical protein
MIKQVVQRVTAGLDANGDLKTFWLIQKKQNVDKRFVNFGSSLYDGQRYQKRGF